MGLDGISIVLGEYLFPISIYGSKPPRTRAKPPRPRMVYVAIILLATQATSPLIQLATSLIAYVALRTVLTQRRLDTQPKKCLMTSLY